MEAAAVPARQQHNSSRTVARPPPTQTQHQQAAARTQHEQALARLQAQRLKARAEQRLPAPPVPAPPAAADDAPAGNKQRLRARVTTTAGSGMQRQAPSRCSSVRGSLELQQGSAGRALQGSRPGLQVQGAAINSSRQQQQQPPAPLQHLRGVTGSSHQQVLSRHVSSRGSCSLRPHCQQAQLCAPVTAARPLTHAAAMTASMGCGHTWGELQAAVAAAAGVQPRRAGGNLEHKRRVQQCRQSIAHLVVRQWRWFSTSSRQLRAAMALRSRRLLTAGWHGLSQEAGRMQLLGCRAQLQATKQSFLLLSRAFTAWQQLVELRKQLDTVTDTLLAHRHRQTLRSVLQAWQQQVQRKRRKQQLLLRAEACYVFMTLLRVLQQWRARTTDKQVSRLRAARADQHWQQVVSRHVLHLWQAKAARGVAKWQSVAKALCFQKQRALSKALAAWSEAVQQQQDARAAAGTAFQGVACRLELHAAAGTLQAWQQAAQVQVQHRQLLKEAAAARQLRTQRLVLHHWQQLLLYQQQLTAAATALQRLQPGVWLSYSFWRWRAIAQVLAGQRGDELRELVQLKACLGTWLQYTELRQHKAARLAAARAALRRLQLDRLLPAWQEATARQQHKHSQLQRAQQHYHEHLQHRLLLVWQEAAAEAVVERLQLTAAAELHRLRLLAAGLKGLAWYPRYLARKAAAPEHYQQRLLTRVLAAWRDRTAAKQRAEQQRRLATRHQYLSTLRKVLQAWREAMAAACHKQQLAAAAERHHNKRLLTAVLQVWQGPLLQHLQDTRKLKQARMAAAQQFRQQQLLHQGMQAFLLVRAGLQQERQELAAAAGPALEVLGQHKQQQVLRAWLAAVTQQQRQRALKQTADGHARLLLLGRSMRQWQRYVAARRHKAAQAELAAGHYQAAVLAGALDAFRQCVRDAAVGRRRMFAAAMHRRSWLIWRAFKAWRLSAAVGHLQRIVARGSGASQPLTAASGGRSSSRSFNVQQRHQQQQLAPQQPPRADMLLHSYQDPASVAAAVVEASCLRQKQWQDGWRSRWQQALTPQQQQQQQQQQDSLIHTPRLQPTQQQQLLLQQQQQQQGLQQQVAMQPVPAQLPSQQQSMLAADLNAAGSVAHVCNNAAHSREAVIPQPTEPAVGQEQVRPGSSHDSSTALAKQRARPQPRLPSFMLQEQQQGWRQQQPLLDSSGWLNTQQGAQKRHPQQLSGSLAGGLSGVVMSRPTTPAVQQQQPTSPAPAEAAGWLGLQQGSLGLTSTSSVSGVARARGSPAGSTVQQPSSGLPAAAPQLLTWLSPQVGRRARLQPRQLKPSLRDSCGVVDSGNSPGRVLQWQTDTAHAAGCDQQRSAEVLVVHSEAVPQAYPGHWAGGDD